MLMFVWDPLLLSIHTFNLHLTPTRAQALYVLMTPIHDIWSCHTVSRTIQSIYVLGAREIFNAHIPLHVMTLHGIFLLSQIRFLHYESIWESKKCHKLIWQIKCTSIFFFSINTCSVAVMKKLPATACADVHVRIMWNSERWYITKMCAYRVRTKRVET